MSNNRIAPGRDDVPVPLPREMDLDDGAHRAAEDFDDGWDYELDEGPYLAIEGLVKKYRSPRDIPPEVLRELFDL